jgi:hypothetical protein
MAWRGLGYGNVKELSAALGFCSDTNGILHSNKLSHCPTAKLGKDYMKSLLKILDCSLIHDDRLVQSCAAEFLAVNRKLVQSSLEALSFRRPISPQDDEQWVVPHSSFRVYWLKRVDSIREKLAKLMHT